MKALMKKAKGFLRKLRRSYAWSAVCYHLKKWFCHEYIAIDAERAREELLAVSPKPSGSAFAQNELAQSLEYDLQIIIPAYNVEEYLERCVDSVVNQKTRYKIRILIINDGSRDRTGEIADSFTDPRIRVIHQANQGASVARNTALKHLNAKYIMFVDADDWMFDGSIDALMDTAMEKDAQIVQGGYHCQKGEDVYPGMVYPAVKKVEDASQLYGFPVGKVYKTSLWENLKFPDGFWFEDTVLSFLLFPRVTNAWLIPESVYVYRQNIAGSTFSARKKPKSLDAYWVTEVLMEERAVLGLPCDAQYQRKFFRQILLNAQRMAGMPVEVRKNVFALTCCLYHRYFPEMAADPQYADLRKALQTRDFGLFTLYGKYCAILFR